MDQPLAGFEHYRRDGNQSQAHPRPRKVKSLPRPLYTQLVDLLLEIHAIVEDRNILLSGLPNTSVLQRSKDIARRDVQLIIDQLINVGRLSNNEWPLLLVIENASGYVLGGDASSFGKELEQLKQNLQQFYDYSSSLPVLDVSLSRPFAPRTMRPAGVLFSSNEVVLMPALDRYYREDFYLSAIDARQWGIQSPVQFAILAVRSLSPEKPLRCYGIRLIVDNKVARGTLCVNQHFASDRGLDMTTSTWEIRQAKQVIDIEKVVLELAVERRKIEEELKNLSRQRRDVFEQRCLLVETSSIQQLSLRVLDRAYFELSAVKTAAETFGPDTLLRFTERSEIQLFVPYRKSAVDMVMLIDGSGSMDTDDYIGKDGQRHTRLFGVQEALKTLILRRQITGNRVSRFAIMVFGEKTAMLYPVLPQMVELTSFTQVQDIINSIQQNLNKTFLEAIQVNRYNATDIARALKEAGELLDLYHQENNEKVIVLLSDGAHWIECVDDSRSGEIVSALADPAALAESLHSRSNIRIHTIGITTEQEYKVWEAELLAHAQSGARVNNTAPDPALLRKIAEFTNGTFFPGAGTQALESIFDEIGEGMRYPLAPAK